MSRAEGLRGEAMVARYLREHDFRLAAHGYRSRFGEIDLIAWDGDVLCFVEVKTRTNVAMALPREYVTPQKQHERRATGMRGLAGRRLDCPTRVEAAEVFAEHGCRTSRIEYIKHAFQ